MKYLIYIIFLSYLIACSTTKTSYNEGYCKDLNSVFDSISKVDNIVIEDTSTWDCTYLMSNKGPMKILLYYKKVKRQQYLMSIFVEDSLYFYRYRKE